MTKTATTKKTVEKKSTKKSESKPKADKTKKKSVNKKDISFELIQQKAYEIYLSTGNTNELDNWKQAENELLKK
jgi:hypothetical protein